MGRSGMALVLVLCILVVLGGFAGVLRALSASAYREVDAVNAHLRAVAVAEIGFTEVVTRLAATPWHERWFRSGPDVQQDIRAGGGAYSYVLRDAVVPPAPADPVARRGLASPHQADLLIRATYDRASAVLYWRLTVPEGALESLARVVPTYFTFAPDRTGARPADLDPLTEEVDRRIREREANRPWFEDKRRVLGGARTVAEIDTILEGPGGAPLDESTSLDGVKRIPQPPYLEEIARGEPAPPPAAGQPPILTPPPIPIPTPPPSPTVVPPGITATSGLPGTGGSGGTANAGAAGAQGAPGNSGGSSQGTPGAPGRVPGVPGVPGTQ